MAQHISMSQPHDLDREIHLQNHKLAQTLAVIQRLTNEIAEYDDLIKISSDYLNGVDKKRLSSYYYLQVQRTQYQQEQAELNTLETRRKYYFSNPTPLQYAQSTMAQAHTHVQNAQDMAKQFWDARIAVPFARGWNSHS